MDARIDLRFSCYDTEGHPQKIMKELGITYKIAVPQSMGDQWWFFDCANVPEVLPEYITPLDLDVFTLVGYGLSKEDVKTLTGEFPPESWEDKCEYLRSELQKSQEQIKELQQDLYDKQDHYTLAKNSADRRGKEIQRLEALLKSADELLGLSTIRDSSRSISYMNALDKYNKFKSGDSIEH